MPPWSPNLESIFQELVLGFALEEGVIHPSVYGFVFLKHVAKLGNSL